jgi:hypothetical protein
VEENVIYGKEIKMNKKFFWISVVFGGVLTTLVSNLPIIGFVNCLVFAGFWGSAMLAVWLYRHLNGALTQGQAVRIGIACGLCAGILGFALSFFGFSGLQGLLNSVGRLLPAEDFSSMQDTPMIIAIIFNLVGVSFNIGFGILGGWLGGVVFRSPQPELTAEVA